MKNQNQILIFILVISIIIIVINNIIYNDVLELFSKGSEIGAILANLSLAYISSYIFYLVVVKYQENRDKRNIYSTVYNLCKQLVGRGNSVVTTIATANNCLTENLTREITKEIYIELCKKTNPKDISPNTQLGSVTNPIPATYSQLIYNDSYSNAKVLIEKIFIYMPFLESDLIKLINDLEESHFFLMASILANPNAYNNTDFETKAEPMFDYHLKLRKIDLYIENNYKKYIS